MRVCYGAGAVTRIFVDGDACPTKSEVYRVALRHDLKVYVVSCGPLHVPARGRVEHIRVARGVDGADDWIAEHAGSGDIVVTADLPLAARCLAVGAQAIAPNGTVFSPESIGDVLATRDLLDNLRQMGVATGGPPPFGPSDRARFLSRLGAAIQAARGGG